MKYNKSLLIILVSSSKRVQNFKYSTRIFSALFGSTCLHRCTICAAGYAQGDPALPSGPTSNHSSNLSKGASSPGVKDDCDDGKHYNIHFVSFRGIAAITRMTTE